MSFVRGSFLSLAPGGFHRVAYFDWGNPSMLRGADSDVLSRATLAQMRASKPGLEVVELDGVGHAPALMNAAQIAAVREFLLREPRESGQQYSAGHVAR